MRKMAIAVALASTAIATPAFARNDAWYIGVEGGAMIVEDINFKLAGASTQILKTDHKAGYDVDGIIGYDFGAFRMEAEVGYKQAEVDGHTTNVALAGIPAGIYGKTRARGTSSALSFMLNGLLDFGDDDGLSGFVGGGVGVARVKFSKFGISPTTLLDDSDTGFAYQALAGIRAPLTDNIDVGLKYRFFNADKVNVIAKTGAGLDTRFRSHSILGSFIYNFGEKAAPMAPPPPPPPPSAEPAPPPPPPAAAACSPGPYIVFFEWDKSDITPEAGSILDNAVTAYGDCGQAQVMLAGHADKSGTPKYNLGLSQRRNDSVQAYLTSKGIPGGVITTKAFGEGAPRVETADGVRELQNRRVEISYGPGSGM
jgi:OmpA-OmpF porin, OOP family